MLKKIENQINLSKAIASSVIGTLSGFLFKKYLFDQPTVNLSVLLLIATVVFLLTTIVNYLTTYLIDNSRYLRKRLLGSDFIEGYWIQKISTESIELMHAPQYSLIQITFEKSHFKISGTSFQIDGSEITAYFQSQISFYEPGKLNYPFTVTSLEYRDSPRDIFGQSKLEFSKIGKLASGYIGHVWSNVRSHPVMVIGKKINEKEKIEVLTVQGRQRIVTYLN